MQEDQEVGLQCVTHSEVHLARRLQRPFLAFSGQVGHHGENTEKANNWQLWVVILSISIIFIIITTSTILN